MTAEEGEREAVRGQVIADCLARDIPVKIKDPVILDRAAAAFRAAEPSIEARRRKRPGR
jgi:hypothetical protein